MPPKWYISFDGENATCKWDLNNELQPVRYSIGEPTNNSVYIEYCGLSGWAIRHLGSCMLKGGEWVYEPMPSNHSNEFYKKSRYPSAEKALEEYKKTGAELS